MGLEVMERHDARDDRSESSRNFGIAYISDMLFTLDFEMVDLRLKGLTYRLAVPEKSIAIRWDDHIYLEPVDASQRVTVSRSGFVGPNLAPNSCALIHR